jgi:DNA topoisomerase-1
MIMTALVIVESPAKAKTLRGYLGRDFRVHASMGHVRDLPPRELGVDLDRSFQPTYRLLPGSRKTLQALRTAMSQVDTVVLATDPDREGEAIAWHIQEACRAQLAGKAIRRVRFHQITPAAIQEALAQPGALNMDLVFAQQARRILDRLVGYQVSPLLWRAISGHRGLSAGRVQSVALRLVVERDREIESFVPEEYWTIDAELAPAASGVSEDVAESSRFFARLWRVGGEKPVLRSAADAGAVIDGLQGADWRVGQVTHRRQVRRPFPPYTTSTLQQDAANRLRWPAKKTMLVAQQLYEGVDLPGEKRTGLITYMRTDSTAVAPEAAEEARQVIARLYPSSLPERPPVYRTRVKNAQEAHEAIRPTRPSRLPAEISAALSPDQQRLYLLIWQRFIASQMKPAIYDVTTVDVETRRNETPLPYLFRARGRQLLESGFLDVYQVAEEEEEGQAPLQSLPPLTTGQPLICFQLLPEQHFTRPPPHFTESALIQALEKAGIGRPSTFAGILDTLYRRGYVVRERSALRSTPLGMTVMDFLLAHLPEVFEVAFTARMEDQLDQVSNGQQHWQAVVRALWEPLSVQVNQAAVAVAAQPRLRVEAVEGRPSAPASRRRPRGRRPAPQPTGQDCPRCGAPLVRRSGKRGPFVGCSQYPTCRFTRNLGPDEGTGSTESVADGPPGGAVGSDTVQPPRSSGARSRRRTPPTESR